MKARDYLSKTCLEGNRPPRYFLSRYRRPHAKFLYHRRPNVAPSKYRNFKSILRRNLARAPHNAMLGIFAAASTRIWVLGVFRRGLERLLAVRLPSAPIHAPARPSIRRRFLLHFWTPLALKQRHQAGSPALGRTEQGAFGHLYTHDNKKTRSIPLLPHVGRVSNQHTTFRNDAAVPDVPLPYFVTPKTKPP